MVLIDELKKLINKVENNKEGDEMDKDLKEKEIDNEKVDKRKLLREADAIAMKPASEFKGGAEEKFRTLTKLMEEMDYNESEAGTADNDEDKDEKKADNKKIKNESEEDKKGVKELKEDMKKDVKNSVDNSKTDYFARMNEVYNAAQAVKEETTYVSRADKLKAGEEIFSVKS